MRACVSLIDQRVCLGHYRTDLGAWWEQYERNKAAFPGPFEDQ